MKWISGNLGVSASVCLFVVILAVDGSSKAIEPTASSATSQAALPATLPVRPGDISEYRQREAYADKLLAIIKDTSDENAAKYYQVLTEAAWRVAFDGPRVIPVLLKKQRFIHESEIEMIKEDRSPLTKLYGMDGPMYAGVKGISVAPLYILDNFAFSAPDDNQYQRNLNLFRYTSFDEFCCNVPEEKQGRNPTECFLRYRANIVKTRLALARKYQTAFAELLKDAQVSKADANSSKPSLPVDASKTPSTSATTLPVLPDVPNDDGFDKWKKYIDELVDIVEKTPKDVIGSKRRRLIFAINELGELHTSWAIPALVDRVADVKIYDVNNETPDDFDAYPVMNALVKIGSPSLPFVADAIVSSGCKSMTGKLLLKVMDKILGDRQKACEYLAARVELMKANIPLFEKYLEYGGWWRPKAGVDPDELARRQKAATQAADK